MGGDYTQTVEQPKAEVQPGDAPAPQSDMGVSRIEFHVSPDGTEVHFHDRTSGLKVAMPVAEWYVASRVIEPKIISTTWSYTDLKHKTHLTIQTGLWGDSVQTIFHIRSIEVDDTTAKLLQFIGETTRGKK
jgi:hypothetical protein